MVVMKELSPLTLYGIAGLVIALSLGYYLEKKARMTNRNLRWKLPTNKKKSRSNLESGESRSLFILIFPRGKLKIGLLRNQQSI